MVLDRVRRQEHLIPVGCHQVPQHEIVTVVFSDGCEATCPIEAVAAHNHCRSESKFHSFEHFATSTPEDISTDIPTASSLDQKLLRLIVVAAGGTPR
jgi:hypothetical protein